MRNVALIGITLAAAGMAWLTQLPVHGSYVGDLLVGLMPMSIGMGLDVRADHAARHGRRRATTTPASPPGLFNTAQQVGGSLGLAILSTLAASQTSSLLHGARGAHRRRDRVSGYHVAFLAAAIMLARGRGDPRRWRCAGAISRASSSS